MMASPPIPSTSPRQRRSSVYCLIRSRSVAITWNFKLELPEFTTRTFIRGTLRLGRTYQDNLFLALPTMMSERMPSRLHRCGESRRIAKKNVRYSHAQRRPRYSKLTKCPGSPGVLQGFSLGRVDRCPPGGGQQPKSMVRLGSGRTYPFWRCVWKCVRLVEQR